jgi:protein involved in polysaccharide export with SLBB domain
MMSSRQPRHAYSTMFMREGSAMFQVRDCAWPLLALTLAACQVVGAETALLVQAQYTPASKRVPGGTYLLGPGDRIRLKVYSEADVTGDYEVNSAGFVSIPLAGQVRASGLTTKQLEGAIRSRLADGMVNDPRVNVEVAAYAPFYIHGEVKTAGEYAYRLGLTIQDAVALAGGFTYRAYDSKVYVRRVGAPVEQVYTLDAPVPVSPGDNIRVPERYF